MTVPATPRRAGPYAGDGATTEFAFGFRVRLPDDVVVIKRDALGVETTLTRGVDYDVTLSGDQQGSPGGLVEYPLSGDPLAADERLAMLSGLPYEQAIDLPPGGRFNPEQIEDGLDSLSMQVQQLVEQTGRTVQVQPTDDRPPEELVDDLFAASAAAVEAEAKISPHYGAIDTVAAIAPDVEAVAADRANIDTVAGIAAEVTTVAGIASDIPPVAESADDLTYVAENLPAILDALEGALRPSNNLSDLEDAAEARDNLGGLPLLAGGEDANFNEMPQVNGKPLTGVYGLGVTLTGDVPLAENPDDTLLNGFYRTGAIPGIGSDDGGLLVMGSTSDPSAAGSSSGDIKQLGWSSANDLYFRGADSRDSAGNLNWIDWQRIAKYSQLLGVGQTWQNFDRVLNTNYTNTTGRAISVSTLRAYSSLVQFTVSVDGVEVGASGAGAVTNVSFILPPGSVMRFVSDSLTGTLETAELR